MSFERIKRFSFFPVLALLALTAYFVLPPPQVASAANARATMFTEAVADPASQADGVSVANSIAAEGAVLGDFCVGSISVSAAGMIVACSVISANTAQLVLQNETAGAVDLAAYTARVVVFKANQF